MKRRSLKRRLLLHLAVAVLFQAALFYLISYFQLDYRIWLPVSSLLTLALLWLEPSLTLLTTVLTFFVGVGAIFPLAYVSRFNREQVVDIPIQRR